MQNPNVILVDHHDRVLGHMDKLLAHQTGALHRAFSVCVLRVQADTVEVLLHQRQLSKYHSPGLWTNACCSHPQPGEQLQLSAESRLLYEMGLVATCHWVGSFIYKADVGSGLIENELDHVFIAYSQVEQPSFNIEEVMQCAWVERHDLLSSLLQSPHDYSPWLSTVLQLAFRAHDTRQLNNKA